MQPPHISRIFHEATYDMKLLEILHNCNLFLTKSSLGLHLVHKRLTSGRSAPLLLTFDA